MLKAVPYLNDQWLIISDLCVLAEPRSYVSSVARSAAVVGGQPSSPVSPTFESDSLARGTSHPMNPPLSSSSPVQKPEG